MDSQHEGKDVGFAGHLGQAFRNRFVCITLGLLAALLFSAWLVWGSPRVMEGCDYALTHHFFRAYLTQAIHDGALPLWNPFTFLGRPFLADPEVAFFYPPTWLAIAFGENPGYWLSLALHMFLGGWGMFRLARTFGASRASATFAACAFVACPPFLGHLEGGMTGFVDTIAWWPWALLFIDRLCDKPVAKDFLKLVAVLAACFLAGHTHAFWLCACSLGFYILPRSLYGKTSGMPRRVLRSYILLALAGLCTLLVCAVELLPLMELASEGNRVAGKELATYESLSPYGLFSLIAEVIPDKTGWWDGELFIGLPVLVFGLFALSDLRDVRRRSLLLLSIVSIVLALGANTPLFNYVYPVVPAMGHFRFNGRFAMFAVFALIVGAATLWSDDGKKRETPSVLLLLAAALCMMLHIAIADNVMAGLLLGLAACIAVRLLVPVWRDKWDLWLFPVFLLLWAVDFLPATVDTGHQMLDYHGHANFPYTANLDLSPDIKAQLRRQPDAAPLRIFVPTFVLKSNSGMVNGLSIVQGNEALTPARVWTYLQRMAGYDKTPFQLTYIDDEIVQKMTQPYPGMDIAVTWDEGEKTFVRMNPEYNAGRTWLVGDITKVKDWNEALDRSVAGFDPRSGALVEQTYGDCVRSLPGGAAYGMAGVTAFSRNAVTVDVNAVTPAVLVLSEAWFPGWQAQIGGKPAKVFPVNVWMRGVVVPAGRNKVVFTYHSTYLATGAVISLLSICGWIAAWIVVSRRTNVAGTDPD